VGKQIKKLSLGIISLVVIALLLTASAIILHLHSSPKQLSPAQIAGLARQNDCSNKALSDVAKQRPDKSKIDGSITLLSYRASCYYSQGKYQQAINEYQQLERYYQYKNDKYMVSTVKTQISELRAMATHIKPAAVHAQPDADPELEKSIQKL